MTDFDALYRATVPHYREYVRCGSYIGWVCAGDDKVATVCIPGKGYMPIHWEHLEFLGCTCNDPSGVE